MKIGIDLDGVCYDFSGSLREYLVAHGIRFKHECPPPTRWEFYFDWGMSTDEFLTHCHRGVEAGYVFTHGGPLDEAPQAIRRLMSAGHTIHIITHRSFGKNGASESATRSWLDSHNFRFTSLTFAEDKTIVPTDWMIEDNLGNYDALDATACTPVLVDRAWNHIPDDARRRVSSIGEFADLVLS